MPALDDAAMEAVVRELYAHPNRRHAVPVESEDAVGALRLSLEATVGTAARHRRRVGPGAYGSRWSATTTAGHIGHGYGEAWLEASGLCAMASAVSRDGCAPNPAPSDTTTCHPALPASL